MRPYKQIAAMMLVMMTMTIAVIAQDKNKSDDAERAGAVYKVEVVVREFDGAKETNARSYVMVLRDGREGRLRMGSKVPLATGEAGPKGVIYMDVGFSLDCTVTERGAGYEVNTTVDISSVLPPDQGAATIPGVAPIVRQSRYQVPSLLQLGKPTIIGSIDDPNGKRRFAVEVTVNKAK